MSWEYSWTGTLDLNNTDSDIDHNIPLSLASGVPTSNDQIDSVVFTMDVTQVSGNANARFLAWVAGINGCIVHSNRSFTLTLTIDDHLLDAAIVPNQSIAHIRVPHVLEGSTHSATWQVTAITLTVTTTAIVGNYLPLALTVNPNIPPSP